MVIRLRIREQNSVEVEPDPRSTIDGAEIAFPTETIYLGPVLIFGDKVLRPATIYDLVFAFHPGFPNRTQRTPS